MTEAEKKARNEYFRKWRAAHKDKVRQYNENYWNKKAALAQSERGQEDGGEKVLLDKAQ